MENLHKFVVKRSEWRRGQEDGKLLQEVGKSRETRQPICELCCLGFLALSLEFTKDDIDEIPMLSTLYQGHVRYRAENFFCPKLPRMSESLESGIANVNDCAINEYAHYLGERTLIVDENHREEILKHLFALAGIEVSFED